jgi:hypothetical protein
MAFGTSAVGCTMRANRENLRGTSPRAIQDRHVLSLMNSCMHPSGYQRTREQGKEAGMHNTHTHTHTHTNTHTHTHTHARTPCFYVARPGPILWATRPAPVPQLRLDHVSPETSQRLPRTTHPGRLRGNLQSSCWLFPQSNDCAPSPWLMKTAS